MKNKLYLLGEEIEDKEMNSCPFCSAGRDWEVPYIYSFKCGTEVERVYKDMLFPDFDRYLVLNRACMDLK